MWPVLLHGTDGSSNGTPAAMASPTSGDVIVSSSIACAVPVRHRRHIPYHAVAPPSTTIVVPVM